jgi:hypothetical protein
MVGKQVGPFHEETHLNVASVAPLRETRHRVAATDPLREDPTWCDSPAIGITDCF